MFVRHLKKLGIAALACATIAGCSQKSEPGATDEPAAKATEAPAETPAEKKVADLVYVNWAEGIAYTHLAKVVLEDKMGYEVKLTAADVGPAYTAVAKGDKDAFMETWLPTLHKDYVDKFQGKLLDLGHVYEGTQSGLVVPAYVTIDKISELNGVKDKFDGKITGIDAGAGIMKTTEQVIESYGLDYKLLASSGPAMTAALKDAIDKKEWIVVTGWRPHWKFGRWDLKFLAQDEDKTVWQPGNIHIMGRADLDKDKPELAAFLRNMTLTDAQLSDLMIKVNDSESKDVAEVARKWMADNEAVVTAWIPKS
ncbi:glycine betaine ABC transporter substrate-binding protein [Haliangium sp.]|uniref:glycine betaine ABC transporter substrate-binding protein n=1 Tax=Haliangium sp. TaxID=2663208 RepID=UPI003D12DDF0